jgi:hypothetical protein
MSKFTGNIKIEILYSLIMVNVNHFFFFESANIIKQPPFQKEKESKEKIQEKSREHPP